MRKPIFTQSRSLPYNETGWLRFKVHLGGGRRGGGELGTEKTEICQNVYESVNFDFFLFSSISKAASENYKTTKNHLP